MGLIIASGNLKGGTGKSTIAVNLACAFATQGLDVVLIDVDPQGTAVGWGERGLLPIVVIGDPPIDLHAPGRWPQRAMETARNVDLVVLDLPPLVGRVLASALMISDLALIPISPSAVDVGPTAEVLRLVRMSRETRQGLRPKALLVPNRVDYRSRYDARTQAAVETLRERWAPPLRQHTDFINAFAAGTWVGEYAPGGAAARDLFALQAAIAPLLGLSTGAEVDKVPA